MLRAHEVNLYVGKRGSRKSTRAKEVLGLCLKAGQRVVVFDPHDEYSQEGRASDEVVLGPLPSRRELWQLKADPSELLEGDASFAVVPGSLRKAEVAKAFSWLAWTVYEAGDLVFAADEMVLFWESSEAQEAMNFLATQGRHAKVPLVLAAQRVVHVPYTARTQVTLLDTGKQDDPDDVAAIAKRCGKDFAEQVPKLKLGERLVWRDE
ncbi:hypothetical protein CYFUS_001706 [Cystobacter fuscus]|uniref:Uncharacterized protein n=1 Tax=Cystobacter fuscus TaxID=43 RepID=A0A250IYI6_9BACT|nr:type IV secretion system DNA-binding domain-containing protein [Cystobacter fuscus]ATB36292.1 hypothetical protein CYFUS_001706 [Cystobacter fuscus]